jgi:hypothetical protein
MEDFCGVVHTILECSVQVGEVFRATAEAHVFAEIVTTFVAISAMPTHDSGFNSNALSRHDILNTWTDCGHDACSLMTEDHGTLESKVYVPSV